MTEREKSEKISSEIKKKHPNIADSVEIDRAARKIEKRKILLNSLSYLGFAVILFIFYFFLVFLRHGFGTTKALLLVGGISMLVESGKLFVELIKPEKQTSVKNDTTKTIDKNK